MTVDDANSFLKRYGLFSFQYRVFYRLSLFLYKNKTESEAPELLKEELNPPVRQLNYNLRNQRIFKETKYVNKYSNIILLLDLNI